LIRRFGDYELVDKIGQGGMGIVYEATDPDGNTVAIKILRPDLAATEDFPELRARFLRELSFARKLNHPNIVRTIDGGELDGSLFLVNEYIPGGSLASLLSHRFSVPEALFVIESTFSAICALEDIGLVHRDIKPENLLLTAEGTIKLSDLGLARAMVDSGTALTALERVVGTPEYMSPEQIEGEEVLDSRCDLYACGVLFFELLTGRRPFEAKSVLATFEQHLDAPPPDPRSLNPAIPRDIADFALELLAKNRDQRPRSPRLAREQAHKLALNTGDALSSLRHLLTSSRRLPIPPITFTAPIERALTAARLTVSGPNGPTQLFVFASEQLRFGRREPGPDGPDLALRLRGGDFDRETRRISSNHFEIIATSAAICLRDLNSTGGTFLAGERLSDRPAAVSDSTTPNSIMIDIAGVLQLELSTINPNPYLRIERRPADPVPSAFITRINNGTDHAYALVPTSISLAVREGALRPTGAQGLNLIAHKGRFVVLDGAAARPLEAGMPLFWSGIPIQVSAIAATDFL
jgi:serine/threonine protein kinase